MFPMILAKGASSGVFMECDFNLFGNRKYDYADIVAAPLAIALEEQGTVLVQDSSFVGKSGGSVMWRYGGPVTSGMNGGQSAPAVFEDTLVTGDFASVAFYFEGVNATLSRMRFLDIVVPRVAPVYPASIMYIAHTFVTIKASIVISNATLAIIGVHGNIVLDFSLIEVRGSAYPAIFFDKGLSVNSFASTVCTDTLPSIKCDASGKNSVTGSLFSAAGAIDTACNTTLEGAVVSIEKRRPYFDLDGIAITLCPNSGSARYYFSLGQWVSGITVNVTAVPKNTSSPVRAAGYGDDASVVRRRRRAGVASLPQHQLQQREDGHRQGFDHDSHHDELDPAHTHNPSYGASSAPILTTHFSLKRMSGTLGGEEGDVEDSEGMYGTPCSPDVDPRGFNASRVGVPIKTWGPLPISGILNLNYTDQNFGNGLPFALDMHTNSSTAVRVKLNITAQPVLVSAESSSVKHNSHIAGLVLTSYPHPPFHFPHNMLQYEKERINIAGFY